MTPTINTGIHHDNPTPNEKRRIKQIIRETEYLIKWGFSDLPRIDERPRYIEAFISTEPIEALQTTSPPATYTQNIYLMPVPYHVPARKRERQSLIRKVIAWITNQ